MNRIAQKLRALKSGVVDALYPFGVQCLRCGAFCHGEMLCGDCAANLNALRLEGGERTTEEECFTAASVWRHTECAAALVRLLKLRRVRPAGEVLAKGMAEAAEMLSLPPDTVVTWVPMPERRLEERGVDHARVLAEAVGARLCLPVEPLMRRREDDKTTQRGLRRGERATHIRDAFVATRRFSTAVLVVDDVTTTGATLRECAACLREAGAADVYAVTATKA